MDIPRNLNGRKVLIYDPKINRLLLATTILKYSPSNETIEIKNTFSDTNYPSKVDLIIFTGDSVFKSAGTITSPKYFTEIEIAFIKSSSLKQVRNAIRYDTNIQNLAEYQILKDSTLKKYTTPKEITILDISTGGIRISASSDDFVIGEEFLLHLNIAGDVVPISCTIARINVLNSTTSEYGCILKSI